MDGAEGRRLETESTIILKSFEKVPTITLVNA